MAATKLGIYNDALNKVGERRLTSLADASKPRRDLDSAWDKAGMANGGPLYCLESGPWNFATRSSAMVYSPSVEPPFGFKYAFTKPVDFLRTVAVCSDPYFKQPLADSGFADETGFWFADLQTIYVKYVSGDASYGLDLSLWTPSFVDFVALYHAQAIAPGFIKSSNKLQILQQQWQKSLIKAAGIDGTNKPTAERPLGNWASNRFGSRHGERR